MGDAKECHHTFYFMITLILFERSNETFETFGATDQDHSQNTNLTFNRLFFA